MEKQANLIKASALQKRKSTERSLGNIDLHAKGRGKEKKGNKGKEMLNLKTHVGFCSYIKKNKQTKTCLSSENQH